MLLCEPAGHASSASSRCVRAARHTRRGSSTIASLALLDRGLRLRLRRQRDGSELTLKVAKQDCRRLPRRRRARKAKASASIDVYGDSQQGAVSLSRTLDAAVRRATSSPARSDVASAAERRAGALPARRREGMAAARPTCARSARSPIASTAASRYDVDISTLPDGERYAEIADKVPLDARAARARQARCATSRAPTSRCAPTRAGRPPRR